MYNIIVASAKSFDNYGFLQSKLDYICKDIPDAITIVSTSRLAERYARDRALDIVRYTETPADMLVTFGESHMIEWATKAGLRVIQVEVNK